MELIPILSFIILVATISTFILAIGAYILYKIRESKGRRTAVSKPVISEAELYTPAQLALNQEPLAQKSREGLRPHTYESQQERSYQPQEEKYQGSRVSSEAKRYQLPPQDSRGEDQRENETDRKFMKYTSEGYVPVSKSKTGENLKWR